MPRHIPLSLALALALFPSPSLAPSLSLFRFFVSCFPGFLLPRFLGFPLSRSLASLGLLLPWFSLARVLARSGSRSLLGYPVSQSNGRRPGGLGPTEARSLGYGAWAWEGRREWGFRAWERGCVGACARRASKRCWAARCGGWAGLGGWVWEGLGGWVWEGLGGGWVSGWRLAVGGGRWAEGVGGGRWRWAVGCGLWAVGR